MSDNLKDEISAKILALVEEKVREILSDGKMDINLDHLRCREITVSKEGNKIALQASQDGCGIWLTRPGTEDMVSIFFFRNGQGPAIGLGKVNSGYDIALSSVEGDNLIQLKDSKGKLSIFETDEIIEKMK